MGEARARRRREAREATQKPDARKRFGYVTDPIPSDVLEQIALRYPFLAGQFQSRGQFITALLQAGMDVCDQDVDAVIRYRNGEAKPVDPSTEPKEERLVLNPDEVPEEAKRVLAAVSPTGYVGKRTPAR